MTDKNEPIEQPKVIVTVKVPRQIVLAAKAKAVLQQRSLSDVVADLLRIWINGNKQ